MNKNLFDNFGSLETLPSDLLPIIELQNLLLNVTEENLEETVHKIEKVNHSLDNYDDLTTNLCDISRRLSKNLKLYGELALKLCAFGSEFVQSLYESIKPSNGFLLRILYKRKVYTKEQILAKIEFDRTYHFFFLSDLNSKSEIQKTKTSDVHPLFLKQFSKLVMLDSKQVKEVMEFGYKRKSIEFLLKMDDVKMFKIIIKKHPKKIDTPLEFLFTEHTAEKVAPIDFAAYYGSHKIFNFLLNKGVSITKTTCTCAVHGGNHEIIELCKEHCNDFSGALLEAIDMHRPEYYRMILDQIRLDDLKSFDFSRVLDSKNYPAIWSFFLFGYDASNLPDGNSLLHSTVLTHQYTFTKLMAHDCKQMNKENDSGYTPLKFAICSNFRHISKILIDSGASTNIKWCEDDTLVYTALSYDDMSIVNFLMNHGSVIDSSVYLKAQDNDVMCHRLITLHAPIDFRNMKGNSALHEAVIDEDIIELQKLLDSGKYDIDQQNVLGFTPFHTALYMKLNTIAAIFISRNCNVNTHNVLGATPLMCATRLGLYDYVALMLEMGADYDYKTRGKLTCLHIATMDSQQDICALLLMTGAIREPRDCFGKTPLDYTTTQPVRILFNYH